MRTVLYFLLAALAATPLFAQDDVEARLRKLESEVEELKQENAQLRKDLGVETVARKTDVKESGQASLLQFGGLIQAQSEAGDKTDSRFGDSNTRLFLRRARMNVSGKFVDDFSFRLEMDLSGSLSNTSGFRAQMTDGYINWGRFGAANVKIGQFKTPFGFEQLYADPRLYTAERSLVSDRLTQSRQIGVQVAGAGLDDRLSYAAGLFNGNGINQNFNDNNKLMAVGRVAFIPFPKVSIGTNAFRTTDANGDRRRGIGFDAQAEIGRAEVWGEYLRDTTEPATRLPAGSFYADGWYAQATYYLIASKLQLAERLETFDPSDLTTHDATRSLVSGVNWYLKGHDLKLQFDWMRSNVPGVSKTQQKVIARLQTAF